MTKKEMQIGLEVWDWKIVLNVLRILVGKLPDDPPKRLTVRVFAGTKVAIPAGAKVVNILVVYEQVNGARREGVELVLEVPE